MVYERHNLGKCLQGFEHINRYFDRTNGIVTAKILPGEYYVSRDDEMVTTVLGSCVSACIRDPVARVGGMNHFMLPIDKRKKNAGLQSIDTSYAARYGDFAMEELINSILKAGGKRKNLEVKIFGGGKVLSHMHSSDVGRLNIEFVKKYLEFEGLAVSSEDTGDRYPRKVRYYIADGRVQVKKLQELHNDTISVREDSYFSRITTQPDKTEELELFK